MEGFFSQLDTFLSSLSPGAVFNLASQLQSKEVLTHQERREVESCGEEVARDRLRSILHTKRDGVQLRALLQTLQVFKLLYKETKDQAQLERAQRQSVHRVDNTDSKPSIPKTATSDTSKRATERAILATFEEGVLTSEEIADQLEETSELIDLRTITNFEGKTLLHLACCLMILRTVRLLIERYEFDITVRDNDGNTPLHDASRCLKTQIVKYLISLPQCDINAQNSEGNTALHAAMECSHWPVGRVLLNSQKLRVSIENHAGETALTMLNMQLGSPETKKMKKDLMSHCSMKNQAKVKHQDPGKGVAAPLATAKRKIQFSDAIEAVKKPAPARVPSITVMEVPSSPTKPTAAFKSAASKPAASKPAVSKPAAPKPAAPTPGVRFLDVAAPAKKSVKMSEVVEIVEVEQEDKVEDKKVKTSTNRDICAACLLGNPSVCFVLAILLVGLVMVVAVIGAAAGALFR